MATSRKVKVGIVSGSGLDDPDILEDRQEKFVDTPYGKPSDALITGKICGVECVLVARHGRKHTINPSEINSRANIWALKQEGCTHILATTACGSLREEIHPGDFIIPDQFLDRTTKRASTFYDGGPNSPKGVCHITMHTPFCPHTRQVFKDAIKQLGYTVHQSGTVITIEGPRFSSRAESNLFRCWGADIINMTTVPEVILAKEAGVCYAAVAMATDYDCWHDEQEAVHLETVLNVLKENGQKAIELLKKAVEIISQKDWTNILKFYEDEVASCVLLP
ncbi:S-methyl-5'-thioadenosine phosphorylase-like [Tachypleus tridentatus]|uniref:S-methyl-5'-thioadenosine phosphorylase-like n=1 Tax=Tachypleus tridentatus TaxID=6853 RepID=UPI003FD1A7DA